MEDALFGVKICSKIILGFMLGLTVLFIIVYLIVFIVYSDPSRLVELKDFLIEMGVTFLIGVSILLGLHYAVGKVVKEKLKKKGIPIESADPYMESFVLTNQRWIQKTVENLEEKRDYIPSTEITVLGDIVSLELHAVKSIQIIFNHQIKFRNWDYCIGFFTKPVDKREEEDIWDFWVDISEKEYDGLFEKLEEVFDHEEETVLDDFTLSGFNARYKL